MKNIATSICWPIYCILPRCLSTTVRGFIDIGPLAIINTRTNDVLLFARSFKWWQYFTDQIGRGKE